MFGWVYERWLSVVKKDSRKLKATEWHDYPVILPVGIKIDEIARMMVMAAVVRRKSDQQVNWILLFSSVGMAILALGIYFYFFRSGLVQLDEREYNQGLTVTAMMMRFEVPGMGNQVIQNGVVVYQTPTLIPSETPTPGVVAYLTYTPVYTSDKGGYNAGGLPTGIFPTEQPGTSEYIFSYYNPDITYPGDFVAGNCANKEGVWCHTVNCWDYDIMKGLCKSKMFSGLDFHSWFGKALACPANVPIGAVYRVYSPEQLKGDWVCLDRGGQITGDKLDFLIKGMPAGMNYGDLVVANLLVPEGVK